MSRSDILGVTWPRIPGPKVPETPILNGCVDKFEYAGLYAEIAPSPAIRYGRATGAPDGSVPWDVLILNLADLEHDPDTLVDYNPQEVRQFDNESIARQQFDGLRLGYLSAYQVIVGETLPVDQLVRAIADGVRWVTPMAMPEPAHYERQR